VEVYNERLDRSSHERLFELAACAYLPVTFQTTFTHARKQQVSVQLGWFSRPHRFPAPAVVGAGGSSLR
jgi:hypothetical protein